MGEEKVIIKGAELTLIPEKAIFWEDKKTLLLADVHLGKAGHFRKHGIPIPSQIHFHDLVRIENLIHSFTPARVVFLGDLFHSDHNNEWTVFSQWLEKFPDLEFVLVKGNHDVLSPERYQLNNLSMVDNLVDAPFYLTHETESHGDLYNLSGHIHPCVRLDGTAKQGLRIPCFFFSKFHGILPAFGKFTGFHPVRPIPGDLVFAVADDRVVGLSERKPLN